MAITKGPPPITMQSLLLDEAIKQAPSTRAMLKELKRRVEQAGQALGDIREVAKLTRKLADLQWELDDLLNEVGKTQASAKSVVNLSAKPAPKPVTDWTPTKADIAAMIASPAWREATAPARMKKLEAELMAQVSDNAKAFNSRHCDSLSGAA